MKIVEVTVLRTIWQKLVYLTEVADDFPATQTASYEIDDETEEDHHEERVNSLLDALENNEERSKWPIENTPEGVRLEVMDWEPATLQWFLAGLSGKPYILPVKANASDELVKRAAEIVLQKIPPKTDDNGQTWTLRGKVQRTDGRSLAFKQLGDCSIWWED